MSFLSRTGVFAAVFMLLVSRAGATVGPTWGDDSDLTGGRGSAFRILAPSRDLSPDRVESESAPQQLILQVYREVKGSLVPVEGLVFKGSGLFPATTSTSGEVRWPANCGASGRLRVGAELKTSHFSIQGENWGSAPYSISAEIPCEGVSRWVMRSDSDAGQALGIWDVAFRARQKLEKSVGLKFWSRPLTFIWPGQGDYYQGGTVNLTRGDQWDVVGHEMGHAIYDLGAIGGMGGGQHKIDECYSETLALSEGWASYFSAFVSVALDDADAKFEFMVPRRAPLRFETIPADVCSSQRNEWRVTGFFWDLLDLHADGETVETSFAVLWNALSGSRVNSSEAAATQLQRKAGLSEATLRSVWQQNFLSSEF